MRLLLAIMLVLAATEATAETPAEKRMASARRAIAASPESFRAYNALALALTQRARETADPRFYTEAEDALAHSFRLSPDNFEGDRTRVWVLLGKHDFETALAEARKLTRRAPDDLHSYALLVDAEVELGNYQEAEEAAQWLLDLRPGNIAGLTRGAYLREIFGDVEGALEFMGEAYELTYFAEVEDRAWLRTQMAHLQASRGELAAAEEHALHALDLFPGYHYALAELAKVRMAQARHEEAAELFRRRHQQAPHPENRYELARALQRAGAVDEAEQHFRLFEREALSETEKVDNANRELTFYYADYARKPQEALTVARREFARRQDVFTKDALAWALHLNGENRAARAEIESALEAGTRDATLLYHAGAICAGLGDRDAAERYWKASLDANPHSAAAPAARQALEALGGSRS